MLSRILKVSDWLTNKHSQSISHSKRKSMSQEVREFETALVAHCPKALEEKVRKLPESLKIQFGLDKDLSEVLKSLDLLALNTDIPDLAGKAMSLANRIRIAESEREKDLPSLPRNAVLAFVYALLAGILTILVFWSTMENRGNSWSEITENLFKVTGTFGDSFGFINAMLSALAFCGVLYTVVLQQKELAIQREEIRLSRMEASRSADALNKQVNLSRQAAKIAGLSEACKYIISTNKDIKTLRPDNIENAARLKWYSEQMQIQLKKLICEESNFFAYNKILSDLMVRLNSLFAAWEICKSKLIDVDSDYSLVHLSYMNILYIVNEFQCYFPIESSEFFRLEGIKNSLSLISFGVGYEEIDDYGVQDSFVTILGVPVDLCQVMIGNALNDLSSIIHATYHRNAL
jgi:hypothetical protein